MSGADAATRSWRQFLGSMVILLVPMPRGTRARLRRRQPEAARRAETWADRAAAVLAGAAVATGTLGLVPGPPGQAPRIYPLGAAMGILTGVPYALERRSLRRRLRAADPPDDPLDGVREVGGAQPAARLLRAGDPVAALEALGQATATPDPDTLPLRALASAALADAAAARHHALRFAKIRPPGSGLVADTGLLLCRGSRFVEGLRLLDWAQELVAEQQRRESARGDAETAEARHVRLAAVEGLRLAGRLRDAVTALDGGPRPITRPGAGARI